MVLLTQLGGLCAFGYSAWQIGVNWYRFRTKNEIRIDDAMLFKAIEEKIAVLKGGAKEGGRTDDFGLAAARTGHGFIFDDLKKVPIGPMKTQLIEDLARLAAWSGQGGKVGHA